jgi:hypothetical protein
VSSDGGLFKAGFMLGHVVIDLISSTLAGKAILFLQQPVEYVVLAGYPIQVVIGKFAPPGFGFAPNPFPLASE